MGELMEIALHALLGPFFDRHPHALVVCFLVMCLMALAWAVLIWWEKRNALRRIRLATGQRVESESELISFNTWMRVQDEEERQSQIDRVAGCGVVRKITP